MASEKILVVDDDKNLLELLRMKLESEQYAVTAAVSEEEAIRAVKDQIFDLALVDLQLVHQDGISLKGDLHAIKP